MMTQVYDAMPLRAAVAAKPVAGEGVIDDAEEIDEDEGDNDNGRSLLLDDEFGRGPTSQTSQAEQLAWPTISADGMPTARVLACQYSK